MEINKAKKLVRTILSVHVEALRQQAPDKIMTAEMVKTALEYAEQDLVILIETVVKECRDEIQAEQAAAEYAEEQRRNT